MDILLDNSAISTLSCRRKFQLTVLEGLTSPIRDKSLSFGDAVHKVFEGVDKGQDLDYAITANESNVDPLTLRRTTTFFHATQHLPPPISIKDKDSGELKPAVELKFKYHYGKYLTESHKSIDVYLCGTIDRIYIEHNKLVILDYKTAADGSEYQQDKKVQSYSLTFQLPFYIYALLRSGILPAEYEELIKTRNYRTTIFLIFYNSNPPRYVPVNFAPYPDYFLYNEVPYIINAKVAEAIKVAELKNDPAPHDGMTVYKACEYCQFRPACLHMGTEKETEYLERFQKRIYNPMEFR